MTTGKAAPTVCIVGSGWRFTSGISYYTCRLAAATARLHPTSAILMRRLIPRRLYPGAVRVGDSGLGIPYPPEVPVYDGVDWFWFPSIVRGIRFLRRQKADVVVFQWWTGAVLHTYLLLAYLARRRGAKVVIEFHEVQDTGEARLAGVARYTSWLGKRLFGPADAWVVHSAFDRDAVRKHYGNKKIVPVIPHGPFDHHLSGSVEPAAPTTDADARTVLFFGTIRPYKGLEHLVSAFDSLTDAEAATLRLLIVGETWEGWHAPLELARRSRHHDRIEIVNRYVRDDEVSSFFERADVVALPYLRSSASGPLHIAMSHGLPVLISDVGGLRDGAGEYEGVTWLQAGDVESIRQALIRAGAQAPRRYVDGGSWDKTARAYDALFAELGLGVS